MMITGCDFHTRYQQIATMDEATGALVGGTQTLGRLSDYLGGL